MSKVFALILLPVCLILLLLDIPASMVGMSTANPYGMLTYHFFHGNLLHLFVNWYTIAFACFVFHVGKWSLAYCFTIACLYPWSGDVPIIGLSGLAFALLGNIFMQVGNKLQYLAFTIASFGLCAMLTNIAVLLHIWCFSLGVVWSLLCYDKERS